MIEIIIGLLTLILSTFLGLFVFYRNSESWTNRLLFILTIFIDFYLVVNYLSLHPPLPTPQNQLLWIRIVMFVCSFIGPSLFLLVHTFPKDTIHLKKKWLIPLLLLGGISAIASLSPFVFSGIQYPAGKPVPTPGPLIPVFFIDFIGLFIFSFLLLLYKWRKSTGVVKMQHFYFLIGVAATFATMGFTTVVLTVIFKFTGLVFLGPNAMLFMVIFVTYAIVRHRFFDMRFIVVRSVLYSLLLLALTIFYAGALFLVGNYITGYQVDITNLMLSSILALIMAYSFQPLRHSLEESTDRFLFKKTYDPKALFEEVGHIMASTLELSELNKLVMKTLLREMKISKGAIILKNQASSGTHGLDNELKINRKDADLLIQKTLDIKTEHMLIYDELPEGNIKDIMRQYDIGLVIALTVEKDSIGAIFLSGKSSGDIYTDEDLRALSILKPEISIAVKNSLQYDQIEKFNITLKEKIKQATADLETANKKLKELDQMKDDFVSVASHELRTPMTAIKSYLWLALDGRGGKLTTKQGYYLDRAYKSTDRLIKLVNDMLNISRIESGRITVEMDKVDIIALAKEVVDEVQPRAQELRVKVAIKSELNKLPPVLADADKIKEVLFNLLGNSIKFTPEGGSVAVNFTIDEKKKQVWIHVKDTGAGIDEKDMPTLFTKFGMIQGSYATTKKAAGTGLGLYISKSIVVLHKGEMTASSEGVNKGATFSFSLPMYKKGDTIAIKPKKSAEDRKLGIIHTALVQ